MKRVASAAAAPDRSSLDQFDAKLHARIAKQRGNYVFSPTSVAIALSIAVDRSFLFFIHDRAGNVLFGGRVIDPRS